MLSDRPAERSALERAVALVMACRAPSPGAGLPAERPHLVVLDLPDAQRAALEPALDWPGPPVPRLVLARSAPGASASHIRVLPVAAPRQIVLANVFAMIEAETRSVEARDRRLRASNAAATAIVAELFDSAALGAGLQQTDLDRGTGIVLAAVSEVGISAWLAEVWRHDAGVYQHTLSVAGYASAFGARIGLARADLARLARSALLHDIGKARIPTEILNKPGRLDPAEQRLMRRHPEIGAALLAAQGGFEPAVIDVVRHHHERLDGTGYPDGLAGAAVSDAVRIVAICDVFSALTERRAYRQPATAAEALAIMTDARGHLDPDLLRAFAPAVLGIAALAA
ncbi:HD domain-containing protein [Methylobacterium sp. NEAU 140]|nr:HD domain-containing phosphohydrolase [Methylobacterium sp. NEAU 140]MDP4021272.1 HD domain-containing protein [Methylobacterium sp. NEAU 140]